jgi:hypothetical protein
LCDGDRSAKLTSVNVIESLAVADFIDCINRCGVDGLTRMTDDHTLHVFDEPPLAGKTQTSPRGAATPNFPESPS